MTDKKTEKKRKEILKDEALDKVTGGCNNKIIVKNTKDKKTKHLIR